MLVPKLAESTSDLNMSKWTNLVTDKLKGLEYKKRQECQAEFLGRH